MFDIYSFFLYRADDKGKKNKYSARELEWAAEESRHFAIKFEPLEIIFHPPVMNQSINQSIYQSINQSIDRSIDLFNININNSISKRGMITNNAAFLCGDNQRTKEGRKWRGCQVCQRIIIARCI